MAAKINRTGKTYGDLTVLETIPGSNSKADTYLVKCNCCGNTMIIGIDALLKGLKCKDCRGKDRKRTYQDLVGEEHNGIKVISLAEDAIGSTGHRNIRYNCMCSCGKEFVAYRSSLLRGKVKSCGCCKHITELLTPSLRYDIMKRDGFRCVLCGRTSKDGIALHVDHILPVSKGGQTIPSNLRTLCDVCNLGKSDKYDNDGLN